MSKVVRASAILCAALLAAATACNRGAAPTAAPPPVGPPLFEDVTDRSGVSFTYRNGEEAGHLSILETLGGGVGLLDFDGDGLLDIYLTGGGSLGSQQHPEITGAPGRLYRNLGNWKFDDVTARVGLDRAQFYSHGVAVADFDNDGWPDLLITGYDGLALFHNVPDGNGSRKFVDVSRAVGLPEHPGWCTSAAWGDLNGDGYPDLYVCRYVNWSWQNNPPCPGIGNVARDVCTPRVFEALPHLLFINTAGTAGRQLREVGRECGLRVPPRDDRDFGKGLGVLIADLTGDRRPDIYVANDTTDNLLYVNDGGAEIPRFREMGLKLGVARDGGGTPNGSMGVDMADYDGSGWPSLWVTNYEGEIHALYRNLEKDGRRYWQFSSQLAGTSAIGQLYVGFGTAFVDIDHDGWEDIVVANGHVLRYPDRSKIAQPPVLFRNTGQGRFEVATPRGGTYFASPHRGRGLAVGDLDNDGRPDMIISHVNEPAVLLRNIAPLASNWMGVQIKGRNGRDVTGARVVLQAGDRRLTRYVKGGGSYLSSGDRRVVFAIPNAETVQIAVDWPGPEGKREVHPAGPLAGSYKTIVEGQR